MDIFISSTYLIISNLIQSMKLDLKLIPKCTIIPNKFIFAAVAKNVITAASLLFKSLIAFVRLVAIVLNRASPAKELINVAGKAANKLTRVTPKIPTKI